VDYIVDKTAAEERIRTYARFKIYANIYVDLEAFINISTPKVDRDYSLYRTYVIFRTLGLRHLVVVDVNNRVVGIITRKDLMQFRMQERLENLLALTTVNNNSNKLTNGEIYINPNGMITTTIPSRSGSIDAGSAAAGSTLYGGGMTDTAAAESIAKTSSQAKVVLHELVEEEEEPSSSASNDEADDTEAAGAADTTTTATAGDGGDGAEPDVDVRADREVSAVEEQSKKEKAEGRGRSGSSSGRKADGSGPMELIVRVTPNMNASGWETPL
jgi:hypothetical protein